MHGLPISAPYVTKDYLETKRDMALQQETTYVYDYPDIFHVIIKDIWKEHVAKCASADERQQTFDYGRRCSHLPKDVTEAELFSSVELVLNPEETKVVERARYPGENDIAMVAWKMSFRTPECPQGT